MKFLPMAELLQAAQADGYAVPSFCVWNAEAAVTVLKVATDLRAPMILMNGPSEFALLTPAEFGAIAHALAPQFSLRASLLLDHGDALEQVADCLEAGYTSVMLDYSARPYAENVAALKRVVEMAHPRGVTVEGEIGHVGKVDAATVEGEGDSTLTLPEEALAYLQETGVDVLAISIGNAHGQYTKLPRLDFDRLAAIRDLIPVPLVLHGGSGTPDAELQRAIALGIAKVNVATELIAAVRESLRAQWAAGRNPWTPSAYAEAMTAMAPVVAKWMQRTGAAGRG